MNRTRLAVAALLKMLLALTTLGLLLFLPAGTWNFPGAWRMILLLGGLMLVLGILLLIANPNLLQKRLKTKETEPAQKKVIAVSMLLFVSCFVLCGLDFRFVWTSVPSWLTIVACVVFILAYLGFAELLRENEYLSRTVEIQDHQQVVSTGLYGIVRHPMYTIITFLFLSMPLIIGSFAGLLPLLILPVLLVRRIRNEEQLLENGLAGYLDYEKSVRYRLIPFLW